MNSHNLHSSSRSGEKILMGQVNFFTSLHCSSICLCTFCSVSIWQLLGALRIVKTKPSNPILNSLFLLSVRWFVTYYRKWQTWEENGKLANTRHRQFKQQWFSTCREDWQLDFGTGIASGLLTVKAREEADCWLHSGPFWIITYCNSYNSIKTERTCEHQLTILTLVEEETEIRRKVAWLVGRMVYSTHYWKYVIAAFTNQGEYILHKSSICGFLRKKYNTLTRSTGTKLE